MSAIDRLLKRWGYAKLDEFGLLLTPDERIVATRPVVLDDRLGARVVGWRDGDLAALELEPWSSPASQRTSRSPVAANKRTASVANTKRDPVAPVQRTIPDPVVPRQPAIPDPVALVQPLIPDLAMVQAPPAIPARVTEPGSPAIPDPAVVAHPSEAEPATEPEAEDEWEWEIVMARARTAAEQIEEPAAPPPTVAAGSSRWLARPALTAISDDTAVTPVAKLAWHNEPRIVTTPARPSGPGLTPKTVIPVPQLPAAADPAAVIRSMPLRTPRSTSQSARAIPSMRRVATRR